MKRHTGFTLIELVAAIVVLGIIAATCAPILVNGIRAYNATNNLTLGVDQLRYALERIAREVREYNSGTCNGTAGTTLNMSTTSPQFSRCDYLISGSTTTATQRVVTISRDTVAGTVSLSYNTPTVATTPILMRNMSSTTPLTFAYYDQSGVTTATATSVRYVQITLGMTIDGQEYVQSTRVALRNQ